MTDQSTTKLSPRQWLFIIRRALPLITLILLALGASIKSGWRSLTSPCRGMPSADEMSQIAGWPISQKDQTDESDHLCNIDYGGTPRVAPGRILPIARLSVDHKVRYSQDTSAFSLLSRYRSSGAKLEPIAGLDDAWMVTDAGRHAIIILRPHGAVSMTFWSPGWEPDRVRQVVPLLQSKLAELQSFTDEL